MIFHMIFQHSCKNNMQRWLSIPYLREVGEEELAKDAADTSGQCTDPDFPPTQQSLYADPEHPPATAPAGADWKRVSGQLYVPTTRALKVLPVSAFSMLVNVHQTKTPF
jgi:hypothetical protein